MQAGPPGPDLIGVIGNDNQFTGSPGSDVIWVVGDDNTTTQTAGNDLTGQIGDNLTITLGSGNDTVWVIGNHDTVNGGPGPGSDTIGFIGDANRINLGAGGGTVYTLGTNDTVTGGGKAEIDIGGTNQTFSDSAAVYQDTVVGFSQAMGDRIHLTDGHTVAMSTQVNGGLDTLITLSDNSTILLKWVSHVDNSFFS